MKVRRCYSRRCCGKIAGSFATCLPPERTRHRETRTAKRPFIWRPWGRTNIGSTSFLSAARSEEHTSELQSLMRISYAVFCLKKKNKEQKTNRHNTIHTTQNKQ